MDGVEDEFKRRRTLSSSSSSSYSSSSSSLTSGSDDDSFSAIQEMHPLQNPLILDSLFPFFEFRQLCWCRLVCKTWLEASLTAWRSCATLSINQDRDANISVGNRAVTKCVIPIKQFINLVMGNQCQFKTKPFKQLCIRDVKFSRYVKADTNSLLRLLNLIGSSLTTLELRNLRFDLEDIADFRDIIYKKCPKLQSLFLFCELASLKRDVGTMTLPYSPPDYGEQVHLKSLSIQLEKWDECNHLITWLELLSHFPSLESLRYFGGQIKGPELLDLLSAIKAVREFDQNKLPLRNLDVDGRIEIDDRRLELIRNICGLLQELQLSLKSLNIGMMNGNNEQVALMGQLLTVNRRTLQTLCVFATSKIRDSFSFPEGIQLESLYELELFEQFCSSVDFLRATPNLRELRILNGINAPNPESDMISNSAKYHMRDVRLNHLKFLKLEMTVSAHDIRRLTIWMPNVETLSTHLNDQQLEVVCGYWRHLKKLEVFGKELTDVGVVGVGASAMHEKGYGGLGESDQDELALPNITLLEKLEYFQCGSRALTNASVYEGFLKMPKLRHIVFKCDLQALEFGDAARNALMENRILLSAA